MTLTPAIYSITRHVDAPSLSYGRFAANVIAGAGGRVAAIAFRAQGSELGDFLFGHRGRSVHVAGSLSGNFWNGSRKAEFRILDAAPAGG